MLATYIEKFGAPKNVVLLRTAPRGYEMPHTIEFMAAVPLSWGYWDRLGIAPEWQDGEKLKLFFSKYAALYSYSDVLRERLRKPRDAFKHKMWTTQPDNGYDLGAKLSQDPFDIGKRLPHFYFQPFKASNDATKALQFMSDLARSRKFQLYILFQPEWDEAAGAGLRTEVNNAQLEYLSRFTDSTYVHVVRDASLVFSKDLMQNENHLYHPAEHIFSEVYAAAIAAIQNQLTVKQAEPLKLVSTILDKASYKPGDQPVVTAKISAQESGEIIKGSVFGLVKPAGSTDGNWVMRAPAVVMKLNNSNILEIKLTFLVGKLDKAGTYDLVVFLRQDVGTLSNETRVEIPGKIVVK